MAILKHDPEKLKQLALSLDLPEPEGHEGLSQEEIQRASMAARLAFEDGASLVRPDAAPARDSWFGDYVSLKEMGWDWRVAAYIAWESSPKTERWPKTLNELAAQVLGLASPRVIYTWRKKNPDIDTAISMMQSAPLYAHRRDVIEALVAVAKDPDYKAHKDRKLFFEMLGDYTPRQDVNLNDKRVPSDDLSQLTDEELTKREAALLESRSPEPPSHEGDTSLERPEAVQLEPPSSDGEESDSPTPATPSGASEEEEGPHD